MSTNPFTSICSILETHHATDRRALDAELKMPVGVHPGSSQTAFAGSMQVVPAGIPKSALQCDKMWRRCMYL